MRFVHAWTSTLFRRPKLNYIIKSHKCKTTILIVYLQFFKAHSNSLLSYIIVAATSFLHLSFWQLNSVLCNYFVISDEVQAWKRRVRSIRKIINWRKSLPCVAHWNLNKIAENTACKCAKGRKNKIFYHWMWSIRLFRLNAKVYFCEIPSNELGICCLIVSTNQFFGVFYKWTVGADLHPNQF